MINKKYVTMLEQKSTIRELFDYGLKRAEVIGADNVFDYSLGNPSVPVPEKVIDKLVDIIRNEDPVLVNGYSPSLGIGKVRAALADSLNKIFDMNYTAANIFPAIGAAGALAHAFRAVVCPGEEIITFAPYFPEYNVYVDGADAVLKVVPADIETFQVNFEKFEEMLTEKTAAVLVNTPNNPSGIVYSEETVLRLADILKKKQEEYGHEIYLISDEPYREIVFDGVKAVYISKYYDNSISCYSYSKSLSMPGARIGYIAVNPKCKNADILVDMFGQISRFIGHNCPTSLYQLLVAECAYDTSDLKVYETNKNILYNRLTELGFECVEPGGTFYMFPRSLEPDSIKFCEKAKEYDLLLVPGDGFGCPGHFRISYCVETEKVERSLAAFEKLAKAYKS